MLEKVQSSGWFSIKPCLITASSYEYPHSWEFNSNKSCHTKNLHHEIPWNHLKMGSIDHPTNGPCWGFFPGEASEFAVCQQSLSRSSYLHVDWSQLGSWARRPRGEGRSSGDWKSSRLVKHWLNDMVNLFGIEKDLEWNDRVFTSSFGDRNTFSIFAGCGGPAIKASTKQIQSRSSLIIWILQMPETMSKTISSPQTEAYPLVN